MAVHRQPSQFSQTSAVLPQRTPSKFDQFWMSGLAAVGAICITNPVDVVKTRLQLQGEQTAKRAKSNAVYRNILGSMVSIGRSEGFVGLQRGLVPACLLQFSSVGTRIGFYEVSKSFCEITPETPYRFTKSICLAYAAGCASCLFGSPFFLLKTQIQADTTDKTLAVGQTRRTADAGTFRRGLDIARRDGVVGLYRGMPALMLRIGAASSAQLATYEASKEFIIDKGNWLWCKGGLAREPWLTERTVATHVGASLMASFAMVCALHPFDFAATRIMNDGKGLYRNSFMVLLDTARGPEGVMGISKGFAANYCRFGPYCVLLFVFLERIKLAWGSA